MINGIGAGWTYVILGALTLVVSLLCFHLEIKFGYKWRAGRPPLDSTAAIPYSSTNGQAKAPEADTEKS